MKYITIVFILLNVLNSFGQDTLLRNFTPNRALAMCSDPSALLYGPAAGTICNAGQTKQYYIFKPANNITLNSSTINFRGYANSGTGTPVITSFKMYGPFNPNEDYATLIENNGATPYLTASATSAVQVLTGSFVEFKHYVLEVTSQSCSGRVAFTFGRDYTLTCRPRVDCENCIPKFQPTSGQYVVTGWVKEYGGQAKTSYDQCKMKVIINSTPTDVPVLGQIVDGWQRMEKIVTGSSAGDFAIELSALSGECYFDDIRVVPYDGSMVSYVYDPVTMRLIAELDERNYAKIYEYDEEGKLIRVKKETEKGIMTIQENRENSSSKDSY
jgi:hypothetical protein